MHKVSHKVATGNLKMPDRKIWMHEEERAESQTQLLKIPQCII